MKLLNQSIVILSLLIFLIIGIWAVIFYFFMIAEIKESVDEGLDNYRRQIVYQAHRDTLLLKQVDFNEGFYAIREIPKETAHRVKDYYSDTLINIPKGKEKNLEPFRMLTTAFEDDDLYYELRVINSMVEKDDLISQVFKNTLWLYILLIVSIFFVNNIVIRRVWKPFYEFLSQLKNYKIQYAEKFPQVKTKTKEFNDLQMATHTLLKHNLAIFEQQKEFIGNAAHELQTPLAISLNKLELLLEKGDLGYTQAGEIGEVMDIIERLKRMNKSLLLLSKIENHQFLGSESIDINEVVRKGVSELGEIAEFKNIEFLIEEEDEFRVEMNPSLAEILILNLLRNALFHTRSQKEIRIRLKLGMVEIINDGEKALDAQTIFNRFQKSDNYSGGSGLGLSIVKAICKLYKFDIQYSFLDKQHHFRVYFLK